MTIYELTRIRQVADRIEFTLVSFVGDPLIVYSERQTMSIMSERHSEEAATQPPAEPGEGEMPDEVCVCGHPRSEHNHVDDMTGCGHFMTDDDTLCECDYFRVISPSQAHDIPAAKLRERAAELERELEHKTKSIQELRDIHLANAYRERDKAVSWIRCVAEELIIAGGKTGDRVVALSNLRELISEHKRLDKQNWILCAAINEAEQQRDTYRAEAERLRGQVAAWMDNYAAAKLAETRLSRIREIVSAQVEFSGKRLMDDERHLHYHQATLAVLQLIDMEEIPELISRDEALDRLSGILERLDEQPAPRPEAKP